MDGAAPLGAAAAAPSRAPARGRPPSPSWIGSPPPCSSPGRSGPPSWQPSGRSAPHPEAGPRGRRRAAPPAASRPGPGSKPRSGTAHDHRSRRRSRAPPADGGRPRGGGVAGLRRGTGGRPAEHRPDADRRPGRPRWPRPCPPCRRWRARGRHLHPRLLQRPALRALAATILTGQYAQNTGVVTNDWVRVRRLGRQHALGGTRPARRRLPDGPHRQVRERLPGRQAGHQAGWEPGSRWRTDAAGAAY